MSFVRAATAAAAVFGLVLVAAPASADVFPPSKFPLTAYASCVIDGDRVNLSMSYRLAKGDASRREVGRVYVSGTLTDGKVKATLTDAVSGAAKRASSKGTYRDFSANVNFRAHEVAPGSVARVTVKTTQGSCSASLTAK